MSVSFDSDPVTTFHLRAAAAPDVLPRCLELLSKRNLVPRHWLSTRSEDTLDIRFEMSDLDQGLARYIAACLRQIVNVEWVALSDAPLAQAQAVSG